MMTLLAVIHILVAIVLIGLVLIQDSKGGGALGMGGGGSNSLLGATGAQTLAAKMTRIVAVIFAVTCIALTLSTARRSGSVVDAMAPVSSPDAGIPVPTPAEQNANPPTPDQPATPTSPSEAVPGTPASK